MISFTSLQSWQTHAASNTKISSHNVKLLLQILDTAQRTYSELI